MSSSSADVSGIGSSLGSGNTYGFTMPAGSLDSSGSGLAGLTGVGSGTSLNGSDFSNMLAGDGANQYGFTMPAGGNVMGGLQSALGGASKALSAPQTGSQSPMQRMGNGQGGVRLQAQNFSTPVPDVLNVPGTSSGNTLIKLLQKYSAGVA